MEAKSSKYQLLKDSDKVSIQIEKEKGYQSQTLGYFCLILWGIFYLLFILIWLPSILKLVILCSEVCVRQVFLNRIDGEGFFPGLVLLIVTTIFVLATILVIGPVIKAIKVILKT